MDTMALLCNLHAEGPTTLRLLRDVGCTTIDDFERVSTREIAEALGMDLASVERFAREGRLLHERFAPIAPPIKLPPRRELTSPPTAKPTRTVEAPPQKPASHPLTPGAVDGLDAAWCEALVGHGILTLEGLVDAPGLALARAVERPFTQLLELQCMARRQLIAPEPPREVPRVQPEEQAVTLYPIAREKPAAAAAPASRREPHHVTERPIERSGSPGSGGPFSGVGSIGSP